MDFVQDLESKCGEYLGECVREFLQGVRHVSVDYFLDDSFLEEVIYGTDLIREAVDRYGCDVCDFRRVTNLDSKGFAALYLRLCSLKLDDLDDVFFKSCLEPPERCECFEDAILWESLLLCLERIFGSKEASAWYVSWNPNPTSIVHLALASQSSKLISGALKVIRSMLSNFSGAFLKDLGEHLSTIGSFPVGEFVCEILELNSESGVEFIREHSLHERYIELILDENAAARCLGRSMFLSLSDSRLGEEVFLLNGCVHAEFYLVKYSADFLKECQERVSSAEELMDVFRTALSVLQCAVEVCKCKCERFRDDISNALKAALLNQNPRGDSVFVQLAVILRDLTNNAHRNSVQVYISKAILRFATELVEHTTQGEYVSIILEYISNTLTQNGPSETFLCLRKILNKFPSELRKSCVLAQLCSKVGSCANSCTAKRESFKPAIETTIQILNILETKHRNHLLEHLLRLAHKLLDEDLQYATEILAQLAPFAQAQLAPRFAVENMHRFTPSCIENVLKMCNIQNTPNEDWESLVDVYCISLVNAVAFLHSPYVEIHYMSIELLATCLSGSRALSLLEIYNPQLARTQDVLRRNGTLVKYGNLLGEEIHKENSSIAACISKACEDSLVRKRLAQTCIRYLEIMVHSKNNILESLFFEFRFNKVLSEYLKILEDELLFKSRLLPLDTLLRNKKILLESAEALVGNTSPRLAKLSQDIRTKLCNFGCNIDFKGICEKYLLADRIKEAKFRMQNTRKCEGYFECFEC